VIGLIAATANGRRNAAHLAEVWPEACFYEGRAKEALQKAWNECDGIVLFLATGAAVRLVAPPLESKHQDPGVVTVDDAARYAVALCGGHDGGANALAARVEEAMGATPVITTASDSISVPALDSLGILVSGWTKARTSRRSGLHSSPARRSTSSPTCVGRSGRYRRTSRVRTCRSPHSSSSPIGS